MKRLYLCVPLNKIGKINFFYMLIINIKDDETIDRALKRYKRKFQSVGLVKELRRRKHFVKPSVERRNEIISASYRLEKFGHQGE